MSVELVKNYLSAYGLADRVIEFEVSSATVALAAQALGCEEAHIAKTLSFMQGDKAVLIVMAGDARIDNSRYKLRFSQKAKMLTPDEAIQYTGHAVGGVCPFALPDGVTVWLDESLLRFETVYPAAGSASSAVRMTPQELEKASRSAGWVDVCKGWRPGEQA
ncbi:MAG: YbaK/EbsC family protein [Ruminococcaceae bacterium]|nr:YbaK/EbsC family protein [Oscillospiraceae bacterium]